MARRWPTPTWHLTQAGVQPQAAGFRQSNLSPFPPRARRRLLLGLQSASLARNSPDVRHFRRTPLNRGGVLRRRRRTWRFTVERPIHCQFRLPYHRAASEKDRAAATEMLLDSEQRAQREREEKLRETCKEIESAHQAIRDRMGAENYHAWQLFKQDLRAEIFKLRRPPNSQGLTSESLTKIKTERMGAFLKNAGVS